MCHSPYKREKETPCIDSIYDYLSRTEDCNIEKVFIDLKLNEVVKENVLVSKKTSLRDSFRGLNTPKNLVNSLHSDSTVTESANTEESTADNNTPSIHGDIQTFLTTNYNLCSLTKHSD